MTSLWRLKIVSLCAIPWFIAVPWSNVIAVALLGLLADEHLTIHTVPQVWCMNM
jgi:hypothetical protein